MYLLFRVGVIAFLISLIWVTRIGLVMLFEHLTDFFYCNIMGCFFLVCLSHCCAHCSIPSPFQIFHCLQTGFLSHLEFLARMSLFCQQKGKRLTQWNCVFSFSECPCIFMTVWVMNSHPSVWQHTRTAGVCLRPTSIRTLYKSCDQISKNYLPSIVTFVWLSCCPFSGIAGSNEKGARCSGSSL